jgi:hypothetical protein
LRLNGKEANPTATETASAKRDNTSRNADISQAEILKTFRGEFNDWIDVAAAQNGISNQKQTTENVRAMWAEIAEGGRSTRRKAADKACIWGKKIVICQRNLVAWRATNVARRRSH